MNRSWTFANRTYPSGDLPLLMGIVNVTPDSFSDGGQFSSVDIATTQAMSLIEQGADLIDIGGESTRPGATPVDEQDELQRVLPVIERLASQTSIPISIDTYKAVVAREAITAGASIVNDISGLSFDKNMIDVCRQSNIGVICMHIQGTPQTMQHDPRYDDVVQDILNFWRERLAAFESAGIDPARVVFDPGIGFGKTAEHNVEILANIQRFQQLGRPILIGHSRKRFIGKILNRKVDERTFGSIGVSLALAEQGVDILRIHDVAAHRDAILAWKAIRDRRTK